MSKVGFKDLPILRISLTGDLPPKELFQLAKDRIKPGLERMEGVGVVTLVGGEEREVRAEVDPDRLKACNLSILQVSQALARENLDYPTGKVDERQQEYIVRLAGQFRTLEEMERIAMASTPAGTRSGSRPGGRPGVDTHGLTPVVLGSQRPTLPQSAAFAPALMHGVPGGLGSWSA